MKPSQGLFKKIILRQFLITLL